MFHLSKRAAPSKSFVLIVLAIILNLFLVGSVSRVYATTNPTNIFTIDTSGSNLQAKLVLSSNGAPKWELGKQFDDSFYIYDLVNNKYSLRALQQTGDLLLQPTGGNAGINSQQPTTALDVNGVVSISPSSVTKDNLYNGSLRITQSSGSGQYINLVAAGAFPWSIGTVYNSNNFAIGQGKSNNGDFTSPAFVISTSGNVGVGTTNPNAKLEINGGVLYNNTSSSQPTCNQTNRGLTWFINNGSQKDSFQVCAFDGTNFGWRTLY